MSDYFLKDNYTQISNDLLEALCRMRLNGEARQVFDFILRKTYGFHKTRDAIATSQIVQATGLSRRAVEKARRKLKLCNMIGTDQRVGTLIVYQIEANHANWVVPTKKSVPPRKGEPTVQMGGAVPTINRNTKHNKNNKQKINISAALTAVFNEVCSEGLNIYQLVGRLKREQRIPRDIPEQVLKKVAEQFLRDKDSIRDEWAWFLTVLESESRKYFAEQSVLEAQQYKQSGPMSLGDILRNANMQVP